MSGATEVTLGPGRLLWSDLLTVSELSGKYGVKIGIPKDTANVGMQQLSKAIGVAKATLSGNVGMRMPYADGDESDHEGDKGRWILRANTKFVPPCFDSDSAQLEPAALYAGCDLVINVLVYPYTHSTGAGVGLMLRWCQFAAAGERLGGGADIAPPPAIKGAARAGSNGSPDPASPRGGHSPEPRRASASASAMESAMGPDPTPGGRPGPQDDIPF